MVARNARWRGVGGHKGSYLLEMRGGGMVVGACGHRRSKCEVKG